MEPSIALIFIIIVIVVFAVVFVERDRRRKVRELESARQAYMAWLIQLANDPVNAEIRTNALTAGRHYSNLTRNHTGATVYDELALSNDIAAVSAAAVVPPSPQPIHERLERLEELKRLELISTDEYRSRREQILQGL